MSRGLTLLEVVISVALLSGVLLLFLGMVGSSGDVLASAHAVTDCVERAESSAARLQLELRNAGVGSLQLSASSQQEGGPLDTISYEVVAPPDPLDPFTLRWSERRVIRFEPQPGEAPLTKVDEDRDGLVDEGQLVLYRDPPSPGTRVAVLCVDVVRFVAELEPAAPGGLASLRTSLRLEQPLRAAVRTERDRQQLASGGGPRVEHTAFRRILIRN